MSTCFQSFVMQSAGQVLAPVPPPGSVPLARILVKLKSAFSTPSDLLLLKLIKTSCAPRVPTSHSARWTQPAHEALRPFDAVLGTLGLD